jgi:hypothetical protein
MTSHVATSLVAAGPHVHLPTGALVAVLLIGALQLALFLTAIIHLVRHPRPQLLPLWAWIVLILVLNLIGSILYLAVGRQRPAPPPEPLEPAGDRGRRAVDVLYGQPGTPSDPDDRGQAGADQGAKP